MDRRDFLRIAAGAAASAVVPSIAGVFAGEKNAAKKKNVLMICVDDLRPELGCYGNKQIISPNIDKLASEGLLFNRAYCQIAVCGPSRGSILSGLRPGKINYSWRLDKVLPDYATTLPRHFKKHGYATISAGKVYHYNDDDKQGWTKRYTTTFTEPCMGYCSGYQNEENIKYLNNYFEPIDPNNPLRRSHSVEASDTPDGAHPDAMIADDVIGSLRELKKEGEPFFVAAGFYRPHLPFSPPKKYWDLYSREDIDLADNPYMPKNGIGFTNWDELRRYGDIPNEGPLTDEKARELIHGYYASVSFADAQIGRVISELERLGLKEDTVILLWGDHGWQLGEHAMWSKHTNYEVATRTSMIVSVPGVTSGQKTEALVELLDIFPTLCELTSLPKPDYLEGKSFVPLIYDPNRSWKKAAFSYWGRSPSMRTERYRVTKHRKKHPEYGDIELYDHEVDPDENFNIAAEKPELVKKLLLQMKELQ